MAHGFPRVRSRMRGAREARGFAAPSSDSPRFMRDPAHLPNGSSPAECARARTAQTVVDRLATLPGVALARIWSLRGDARGPTVLATGMNPRTPPRAARAGDPSLDAGSGRLAQRWASEPLVLDLAELPRGSRWDGLARAGIAGLASRPLVHGGRACGVLEVFTWRRASEEGSAWLGLLSDLLAARLAEAPERAASASPRAAQPSGAPLPIVGSSPALRRVLERVALVAPTDATVLVTGESGTGKELVAREVHRLSRRAARDLVTVNSAALPAALVESELFGHVRGAFSGATRDRAGRFARADGGTLFLDEIGELPLELQGKLLRVLQEGQFERLGDDRTRTTDVRLVVATHRDLDLALEEGTLREDLFYRLNVFPIHVPPLRERREDVLPLAHHFLARLEERWGRSLPRPTASESARLTDHPWPGNVRELEHATERAAILAVDGVLRYELGSARRASSAASGPHHDLRAAPWEPVLTVEQLRELERRNLQRALELSGGKVSGPGGAAELLRVNANTLASQVRRAGSSISA